MTSKYKLLLMICLIKMQLLFKNVGKDITQEKFWIIIYKWLIRVLLKRVLKMFNKIIIINRWILTRKSIL